MKIKEYFNSFGVFLVNRLAELLGLFLILISILMLVSLASYSPEDPTFIFPENQLSKNLLGMRGSHVSDFFFQSFGLISLLIPFTIFFYWFFYNKE